MQTKRIESIDILRGLVIALMTLDHTREFFFMASPLSDPMNLETTTAAVFFSRWLAHFCAPTFVFLAGISAYLYGQKVSKKELSLFLLKRGMFLVLLEVTIVNFAWVFSFPPSMLYLQVIWAIGLSMIALGGMIWLPKWWLAVLALFLIAGHHLLSGISFDGAVGNTLWSILYERSVIPIAEGISARTSYPVLPWIGIIALGYLYGGIFSKNHMPEKRKATLLVSSLICVIFFVILRVSNLYGENNLFEAFAGDFTKTAMSFFNMTKYPPSLLFTLMTLSFALLLLHYLDGIKGLLKNIFLNFGRVPMFYYIAHLYVLHIVYNVTVFLAQIPKYSVSNIGVVWLISIATLALLYPAVIWFGALKSRSNIRLLRYI
jgi:uncharacterized membrane protein